LWHLLDAYLFGNAFLHDFLGLIWYFGVRWERFHPSYGKELVLLSYKSLWGRKPMVHVVVEAGRLYVGLRIVLGKSTSCYF
jgi:hypothetical protein